MRGLTIGVLAGLLCACFAPPYPESTAPEVVFASYRPVQWSEIPDWPIEL